MLTGTAKANFDKWLYTIYFKEYYQYQMIWQLMGESARNGVYLEWFDSQSVFIEINQNTNGFYFSLEFNEPLTVYKTRSQATAEAIKKANEIFNTRQ